MRPDEWAHRHCPRRTANRPVCGTWPTQSTDFFAVRLSLQTFCGRGPSAVQEQYQIRPGIFLPWMSPIRLDGLEGITIKSGWFPGGKGGRHVPLSRRDISRIARRFNAGKHRVWHTSPEGTAEGWVVGLDLRRPFGTRDLSASNPALKRWAILDCPVGTPKQWSSRADNAAPVSSSTTCG